MCPILPCLYNIYIYIYSYIYYIYWRFCKSSVKKSLRMLCSSNILYVISQPPETNTRGYTTTPECCKVVLRYVEGPPSFGLLGEIHVAYLFCCTSFKV